MAVPVPAGHHPVSAMVTAPGRAIIAAQVSLASGRANMNNVTGTLPVANGGTGATKLGSGLSVDDDALNLGPLTDSGSGASVQTDGCGIFGVTGEGFAHQDGTPTPDSPVEIEVARGRNLLARPYTDGISKTTNGVTFTVNDDGSISVSGTPTGTAFFNLESTSITALAGKQVVLSGGKSNDVLIGIGEGGASSQADTGNGLSLVVPSNYNTLYVRVSSNAASQLPLIIYPQLELGSTATPYVPYGHVGLEVQGRNLLPFPYISTSPVTVNGVTFTMLEDGGLKMSGTASSSATFTLANYARIRSIGLVAGETYSIYADTPSGVYAQYFTGSGSIRNTSFVMGELQSTANMVIYVSSGITVNTTVYPMLVKGSIKHAYEPYHHTTTPIPLPAKGWAGGLPDGTADKLAVDSAGRWEWKCPTAEAVFDGSSDEEWIFYSNISSVYVRFNGGATQILNGVAAITDLYHRRVGAYNTLNDNEFILNTATFSPSSGFLIVKDTTNAPSADAFKSFLSTHPMTLLYPLATPTIEHGYIQLPELPNGATVSIPELESIDVEWWVKGAEAIAEHGRDVSKANKEQEDRIAELEAAVATLATS